MAFLDLDGYKRLVSKIRNMDSKDNTVTYTSEDSKSPSAWTDVAVLATGEKHSSIINKISNMFKNVRWLYGNIGAIRGITDSLTATSSNVALSAAAGKSLQDQVSNLNTQKISSSSKDYVRCVPDQDDNVITLCWAWNEEYKTHGTEIYCSHADGRYKTLVGFISINAKI